MLALCFLLLSLATASYVATLGKYEPTKRADDAARDQATNNDSARDDSLWVATLGKASEATSPFYNLRNLSPRELRDMLQQNFKIVAIAAAAVLVGATLLTCAMSADSCVRWRLNRNRRVPIGVSHTDD